MSFAARVISCDGSLVGVEGAQRFNFQGSEVTVRRKQKIVRDDWLENPLD